jgi:hypothetical protein
MGSQCFLRFGTWPTLRKKIAWLCEYWPLINGQYSTIAQQVGLDQSVARIASMTAEELQAAIQRDECPHRPEFVPLEKGTIYDCPLCEERVIAGQCHLRWTLPIREQLPPEVDREVRDY